jgi:hypothetical protein
MCSLNKFGARLQQLNQGKRAQFGFLSYYDFSHYYWSGVGLGVDIRTDTRKTSWLVKRDQAACSKYVNHSKLNSEDYSVVLWIRHFGL